MRGLLKFGLMIAACLALLIALFAAPPAAPPLSQAAPQGPLVRGTVVARIDFRIHSGLITVPVRINGSKELRMYLDTGMSAPVVVLFHKESIAELGLKGTQPVLLGGAGEKDRKPGTLAPGATVEVGPLQMPDQTLVVMSDSRETSDWPVDGVIGKSLFDKYLAEIDYEKSTVTFYDPAGATIEAVAAPIPVDLADGMPVVQGAIDIEGGNRIPLRLIIDLGHRNAFSLSENYAKGIRPPKRTIETIAGRGIQGEIPGRIGRVKSLELGEYSLADIPADFLAPETNAGVSRANVDGNVGSLVLNRFRIILDYPRKRMFLVPNIYFGGPFPVNMAGLVLEQNRDDDYFVRHVIKRSPAAKKGVKAGDKITAIDGHDTRKYSYREMLDIFNGAGRKVKLTIARNGQVVTKSIKLRRLI